MKIRPTPLSKSTRGYAVLANRLSVVVKKQREAIRFLLDLRDRPTEGAFTYATIRRIDEIRKIAGV